MASPAVKFYQMTSWSLEKTLPRLMELALERNVRVLVHGTPDRIKKLDEALWTFAPDKFLPHGVEKDPYPDEQPILLSIGWNPLNDAELLVITDGTLYDGELTFSRIFDLFDGTDDEASQAARERWKVYKSRNWQVSFARQKDDGGWAESAG